MIHPGLSCANFGKNQRIGSSDDKRCPQGHLGIRVPVYKHVLPLAEINGVDADVYLSWNDVVELFHFDLRRKVDSLQGSLDMPFVSIRLDKVGDDDAAPHRLSFERVVLQLDYLLDLGQG